ncbi:hypothetical protein Pmani_015482 [Petrolisthes manimaculis]|uniref:Uncharacterized protein n=1 Tax=Petrolisthes manimaculis TaxID=1843537 RepID=A0AAE1PQU4_9EUCA|nr:hypothetical protein Pmani_015482 [Petrolisthes manimaculis]
MMECSRCKSRHTAHQHTLDSDAFLPLLSLGRGRPMKRARVIREGVARWTFPARTPTRPSPHPHHHHHHHHHHSSNNNNTNNNNNNNNRHYQGSISWSIQMQQSVPDMEGVVSEDLRQRVERVLCFPVGGGEEGEGEESLPPDSQHHQSRPSEHCPLRSPAGALLQEYLDQLEPGEALGEDEDEEVEEELIFAGMESNEESDEGDLILEPEGETYTTPYLLYLQHIRSRRHYHHQQQQHHHPNNNNTTLRDHLTLPRQEEEEEVEEVAMAAEEGVALEGREGAVGRSGHRSGSLHTSSRTPTDSKGELQTPATDTNRDRSYTSTNGAYNRDQQDQKLDPHVAPTAAVVSSSERGDQMSSSKYTSDREQTITTLPPSGDKNNTMMKEKQHVSSTTVAARTSTKEGTTTTTPSRHRTASTTRGMLVEDETEIREDSGGGGGGGGVEYEEEEEEEGEEIDEQTKKSTKGDKGKKKRKKNKNKNKKRKTSSKGERTTNSDETSAAQIEEENSVEKKLEMLNKSTALSLFRQYARTIFAQGHPTFKLFESFEPRRDRMMEGGGGELQK